MHTVEDKEVLCDHGAKKVLFCQDRTAQGMCESMSGPSLEFAVS